MNSSAALSIVADNDPGIVTLDDGSLSLTIPAETSFEDWQAIGRRLFARERVINWWIGDWWAFGEHRYGERAKMAAEGIWGLSFGGLQNLGSISRSFETSRRREDVSFTHHAEVAALPPADGDALLEQAASEKIPCAKLRTIARLRKIDLGLLQVADANHDDRETKAMKKLQFLWNGETKEVREYLADAIAEAAEAGYEDIDLC